MGFTSTSNEKEEVYERMKDNLLGELRKSFRPEFLNRVDDVIVFHQLEEEHLKSIVGLMLKALIKRIEELDIRIEVTENTKELLVKKGFDPVYGARPLRRAIQKMLEDKLSEEMLAGRVKAGSKVVVDSDGEKLIFL